MDEVQLDDDQSRIETVAAVDVEALTRQRIRFDGYFTGATW